MLIERRPERPTSRIAILASISWFILGIAGCNVDPGVDDVRYACTSSSQCGEGFECKADPSIGQMVCVPDGTSLDVGDADASDAGTCDEFSCPDQVVAVRINMTGRFPSGAEGPELHAHPDGALLLSGVYDSCITFNTATNCAESNEPRLTAGDGQFDGFVSKIGADGTIRELHPVVISRPGIFALDETLLLSEASVLSDGTWVVGGVHFAGVGSSNATYNGNSIPADERPDQEVNHQGWVLKSDDNGRVWSHELGWEGVDTLRQVDSNASDQILFGGKFGRTLLELPQTSSSDRVDASGENSNVYIYRVAADGTPEAVMRLMSANRVELLAAAIADDGTIAAFAEYDTSLEPYYDSYSEGFPGFGDTPTNEDFPPSGTASGRRNALIVQPPDGSPALMHDLSVANQLDVKEAGFAPNGDLVMAGHYESDVDFGDGTISASDGGASVLARWDPGDLSPAPLVEFDSETDSEAFFSWGVGPQGGYMVGGRFQNDVNYRGTTVDGDRDVDGLVAEFDDVGDLLWHQTFDSEGTVVVKDAVAMEDGRGAALVQLPSSVELGGQTYGTDGVITTWVFMFPPPQP